MTQHFRDRQLSLLTNLPERIVGPGAKKAAVADFESGSMDNDIALLRPTEQVLRLHERPGFFGLACPGNGAGRADPNCIRAASRGADLITIA